MSDRSNGSGGREHWQEKKNEERLQKIEKQKVAEQTAVKPSVPSVKPAEAKPNVPEISAEMKAYIDKANQDREQAKQQDKVNNPEALNKPRPSQGMGTSQTSNSLDVDWLDKKLI